MRKTAYRLLVLVSALVILVSSALAQDNLDPNLRVIGVSAGADQVADCGAVGGMLFNGGITNGYTSEDPIVVLWINTTTGETVSTSFVALADSPMTTTTYRLLVWNMFTGEWGDDFMTVSVQDMSGPAISLLGAASMYVECGGSYFESGWTVWDNCDPNPQVSVSGFVDTSVLGSYVLTYAATDAAGNTSFAYRTVNVVINWSGLKAPVDPNGTSIFKQGSTVPLKFELLGSCAGMTDLVATLTVSKMTSGIAGSELVPESTAQADTGNTFRYSNGQYAFNLSTKGLTEGTYEVRVNLGDGFVRKTIISIKS